MKLGPFAAALFAAASPLALALDGELDPTFGDGGKMDFGFGNAVGSVAYSMAVASDGRIYLIGANSNDKVGIARLRADGSPDTSYGSAGTGQVELDLNVNPNSPVAGRRQSNGKLVVAVERENGHAICRVTSAGELDDSFGNPQTPACHGFPGDIELTSVPFFPALDVLHDDTIIVAGIQNNGPVLFRFDSQGQPHAVFGINGKKTLNLPKVAITDIAEASNGQLVFSSYNSEAGKSGVIRLSPDGTPDESFAPDGYRPLPSENPLTAVAAATLSDGSVLAASYASISGYWRPTLTKLRPDGTLDPGFIGSGHHVYGFCTWYTLNCDWRVTDLYVQTDGKIVLTGIYMSANENFEDFDFFAKRVLPNGTPDDKFGSPYTLHVGSSIVSFDLAGVSSFDAALATASHGGRILLAGHAQTNTGSHAAIARLNNDLIFADDLE